METFGYIHKLRLVGGHPAVDFVNTVDGDPEGESRLESLRGYGDLVAWSVRVGLIPADAGRRLADEANRRPEVAEAMHLDALKLREALYGVLRAVAEGADAPAPGLEILRGYEREALARGRLVQGDEGFDWEWRHDRDLAGPLWPVAHAATGLLTSGDLGRLKLCAGCHWLFLDASRNHSRRWCTMEVCGTSEKMRRYVAKRAARGNSERRSGA